MSRPLAPHGGNDCVMTPRPLARQIIEHFNPTGRSLDPCRGDGAFYDQFDGDATEKDWCEIAQGRDFLKWRWKDEHPFTWVITNPPWSLIRPFLKRSMEVADNVAFLCLVNAFWMKARLRDMKAAGFGIREILLVETPPKPWPQTGFQLGTVHVQRGWSGAISVSQLVDLA